MDFMEFFQNFNQEIFSGNNQYLTGMFYTGIIIFLLTLGYYWYLQFSYTKFRKSLIDISNNFEDNHIRIHKINESFAKKKGKLKRIWERYYNEYNNENNKSVPDPLYYFNSNELINKAGFRKLIEIIPAVFVSLGLLGTFIGIIIGISELNTNEGSEALFLGIDTLLQGMAFAFYSSIMGILISLTYQFIDRLIFYKSLQTSVDRLLIELDKTIPIETESSLLEKVANAQEEQLSDMKTFFTDQFLPVLTSGISDSISDVITPQLEKSNEIMDRVSKNTLEAQSESLNEMVNHFVSSLNEITGNHIEELGNALHKTVEWQEKVYDEMSSLVNELANVAKAQGDMAKKTTELSEEMNTYTEKLANYQDRLSNTTNELESITEENTKLLSTIGDRYEQLVTKHDEESNLFEQKLISMGEMIEKVTSMISSFTTLNEEMKLTIEAVVNTTGSLNENIQENQKLTETLMEQHEVSNQWSTKTQELLEDITQEINLSENIQETLENLYETVSTERRTLNQAQSQYSHTLTTSVDKLSELWNENSASMSNSQSQLTNLNESLSTSMESFAEHMHRGVQGTFEQFDGQLKNAINYLDRGVSSIGNVMEALEADISDIDRQINQFNQYLRDFNSTTENRMVVNE